MFKKNITKVPPEELQELERFGPDGLSGFPQRDAGHGAATPPAIDFKLYYSYIGGD
ncbi:MAG: hypothetical protein GVY26_06540 [Bacteroidetes bacterium]|nr:hypothetical protein [Bacteroidota bacterium]